MGDEAGRQGEYFIKRVSRFWQYRATSDISTEERRPICYPLALRDARKRERGEGGGGGEIDVIVRRDGAAFNSRNIAR